MTWDAEEIHGTETVPFVKTGHKFLSATAALQANSMRALLCYQIEGASFLKRRLEDDLNLIERLTGGDGFADSFDVFVNFVQNAASDYASQAGRLASIGARLATETAGRLQREAETTVDDMAAATLAA